MLGHRWQPTLGHCNFARRRNVGPTLVCQQRTNVWPTVRQRYGPTWFSSSLPTFALQFAKLLPTIGFTLGFYSSCLLTL